MDISREPRALRERRLALVAIDLAGFTRGVAAVEALRLAEFLDVYYRLVSRAIHQHGGRIVKFMGDGCFAVFPEEQCAEAVEATMEAARMFAAWDDPIARIMSIGANVHLAIVAEGYLGPDEDSRYDIIGAGVNYLFRMGSGRGVRISEPVYRKLPSDRRSPWHKQKPPATYILV
jgi:adenylate cyclase